MVRARAQAYEENVLVNKTVRLFGEGFPVIDGGHSIGFYGAPTVIVIADNVTVNGFVILHTGWLNEADFGVALWSCSGCNISGNIIRFNRVGVEMDTGDNNHIISNNRIEQVGCGIDCCGSGLHIRGNTISSSGGGIIVWSPSNSLMNNTVVGNGRGIDLHANETTLRAVSYTHLTLPTKRIV